MIYKPKSTKSDSSNSTNNSIEFQTFVYTQLNDLTVLFQRIIFSIG